METHTQTHTQTHRTTTVTLAAHARRGLMRYSHSSPVNTTLIAVGTGSEIVTGIKSALIENKSGEWSERTEPEWMAQTLYYRGERLGTKDMINP